jgi:hypothetical protein
MRNPLILALGLAASLIATAALARPPGPDEIGEFYFYFDANGEIVGEASMDCNGNLFESGVRTNSYSSGHAICPQD